MVHSSVWVRINVGAYGGFGVEVHHKDFVGGSRGATFGWGREKSAKLMLARVKVREKFGDLVE